MLKPEHVTLPMLQLVLGSAVHHSGPIKDGWLRVEKGLRCIIWLQVDATRKFVKIYTFFNLPHLDPAAIAAAACRLNVEYFLVKFIARSDNLGCSYELPYGEGLDPANLIRLMRRFASVSFEAFESLPKPCSEPKALPAKAAEARISTCCSNVQPRAETAEAPAKPSNGAGTGSDEQSE